MAFDPHYSSSFSFSNFHVPTINRDVDYLQMQYYKDNLPFLDDEFMKNNLMSSSSSSSRAYFSDEFGVPHLEPFQECDVNSHVFGEGHYPVYCAAKYLMEEEEEKGFQDKLSGGMAAEYWPEYQPTNDNWEIQEQRGQKVEEATAKVTRYSVEERREKILKYLKKRNQRNFNKTIKYACRKTLADRRLRVRGRFAKNSEISEDEAFALRNNDTPLQVNHNWYYDNNNNDNNNASFQVNMFDEEWLQAIASLKDNNVSGWAPFANVEE